MSISGVLVIQARIALGLSQRKLGEMLGISERTVQRWEDGGAIVLPHTIATLTTEVLPKDPDLAARIAAHAGTSLAQLGVEKAPEPAPPPPAPPPPPALPPLPTETLVDSIVCVAADAIGVLPRAIRPALAAAFRRAREVRLEVGEVADSLGGGAPAAKRRAVQTRRG